MLNPLTPSFVVIVVCLVSRNHLRIRLTFMLFELQRILPISHNQRAQRGESDKQSLFCTDSSASLTRTCIDILIKEQFWIIESLYNASAIHKNPLFFERSVLPVLHPLPDSLPVRVGRRLKWPQVIDCPTTLPTRSRRVRPEKQNSAKRNVAPKRNVVRKKVKVRSTNGRVVTHSL